MATFNHNGAKFEAVLTEKAKAMGVEKLHIEGRRWFQKSYGNTYHTAVISALIDGKYVELGKTRITYGYGDHYQVTAGEWLIANGFIACDEKEGYALANYSIREALNVETMATDVKKKAYL